MEGCQIYKHFNFQCKLCGCYLVPFFMFSDFCRLDFYNDARVALAKSTMYHIMRNRIENHISPDLVMVIGSACMSVDS